jgi:hypothetical protein
MQTDFVQNAKKIEEFSKFLEGLNSKEILDILHFLRIQFADHYREFSKENFSKYEEKLEILPHRGGVYIIFMIDYVGDVILYFGKTSGKSKTSGLWFRVKDHTKLLGKTPLTVFIPNWWIKRVYSIPLEDKDKTKKVEEALWMFLEHNANEILFYSLMELEEKIFGILHTFGFSKEMAMMIELQPQLTPRIPFHLKRPPAGEPRYLKHVR